MSRLHSRKKNPNSEAGFTLVEALVALMLTGMIGLALLQGYRFGNRVWERGDERGAVLQDRLLAYSAIRDWLQTLAPVRVTDRAEFQIFPIEGRSSSLTFTSYLLRDGSREGQTRITLGYDAERQSLSVSYRSEEAALTMIRPETIEHVILGDVEFAAFSYFEKGGPGRPGRWVDIWDKRAELPAAIHFSLEMSGEGDDWPPLIIRPRIEDDVTCVFDPVSRACREGIS